MEETHKGIESRLKVVRSLSYSGEIEIIDSNLMSENISDPSKCKLSESEKNTKTWGLILKKFDNIEPPSILLTTQGKPPVVLADSYK